MIFGPSTPTHGRGCTKQFVDELFERMDKNHDELLTLEEFKDGCKTDSRIVSALSVKLENQEKDNKN